MSDPADEIRAALARLRATTDEPFPELPEPAPFYTQHDRARAVGAAIATAKGAKGVDPETGKHRRVYPSEVNLTKVER